MSDHPHDHAAPSRRLGAIRRAIGFVAGVLIWALNEAGDQKVWPATVLPLFGALALVTLLLPFVLVGGLGALRARTLAIWSGGVAILYGALGWHDLTRGFSSAQEPWVSPELMVFGAAGLFIGHHLVAGADADRRVIAAYPRYFDLAWKHGVQLALSAAFVGVFWIILFLGGALFDLIGVEAVNDLLREEWFAIPATATMFAAAVHLTDIRVSLIRGIRTVALTLLSWLLPVLTVLGAAFLLTLPFTGLDPLWRTRSAAAILLSSAAVLIVLINAAWQDGEPDGIVPPILRWTTRLSAALLPALVLLAAYALFLRISQYGLTPDRVVAAACTLAAAVYAVGYVVAAVRPGRWMRWVAHTNIAAAFVVLALLLGLFTPIADPARLSVNDQIARLKDGRVSAARFDYSFLRWDAGRYGREALAALKKQGGDVGRRAVAALKERDRWRDRADERPEADDFEVIWPKGRALPAGFLAQAWDRPERSICMSDEGCEVVFVDLTRDGVEEVVVTNGYQSWVHGLVNGQWTLVGAAQITSIDEAGLKRRKEALGAGRFSSGAPRFDDLVIDGSAIPIVPATPPKEADGPPGDTNLAIVP